ncbi:MAG: DDE-type integrase/transposase/recombinase [Hahellaceae bacterium]|nr:DDE-type integrase/transposase/recombinase [Hahellaceae bacterium]MCP5210295.1 DDE-type integrase/transposase/recombinase [Hahellaceae bacterium]
MLNDEKFEAYCEEHGFDDKSKARIEHIRNSEPARLVQATRYSGAVRFASNKMCRTIQANSRTVEFPYILRLECDRHCLEYYDQPETIRLRSPSKSGRMMSRNYTADIMVVYEEEVEIWECKKLTELERLHKENPEYISLDDDGNYRNLWAEKYYEEFSIKFVIKTDGELDPIETANFEILETYFQSEIRLPEKTLKKIRRHISSGEGATIKSLLDKGVNLDDIYQAITDNVFPSDFTFRPVIEHANYRIFLHKRDLEQFQEKVENYSNPIRDPQELTPELAILSSATTVKLAEAKERKESLDYFWENGIWPDNTAPATGYEWQEKYRVAEETLGNGFLGLVGLKPGPKGSNLDPKYFSILNSVKESENKLVKETGKNRSLKAIRADFNAELEKEGLSPLCRETFSDHWKSIQDIKSVGLRYGHKVRHSQESISVSDNYDETKFGLFPMHTVHSDHTPLNVFIRGQYFHFPPMKPVLTTLLDGNTRKVLSFVLTLQPASVGNELLVLRRFFMKYPHVMKKLVLDGGGEFQSVKLETLIAFLRVHKVERRKSAPKDGAQQERPFGTIDTELVQNLMGNNELLRMCRQFDPKLDPRKNAVWTLESLEEAIQLYFDNFYHVKEHKGLGCSPNEMWAHGTTCIGERTLKPSPSVEEIIHLTRMPSRVGSPEVGRLGFCLEHAYFSNSIIEQLSYREKKFPGEWDPDDVGVGYIHINNQWENLKSRFYGATRNLTPHQISCLSREYRYVRSSASSADDTAELKLYRELLQRLEQMENGLRKDLDQMNSLEAVEPKQRVLMGDKSVTGSDDDIDELEVVDAKQLLSRR